MSIFREQNNEKERSLIQAERSDSPELSNLSMRSMEPPYNIRAKNSSTDLSVCPGLMEGERSDSPEPSHMSMKSDQSMEPPYNICSADRVCSTDLRQNKTTEIIKRNQWKSIFKDLEHKVINLLKNEMNKYRILLNLDYPECTEREVEDEKDQSPVCEGALKITLHVLQEMDHSDLAIALQSKLDSVNHINFKSNLIKKYGRINEGISQYRSALLNEIYTELYITEGWSEDINNKHEVRQIETMFRRPATQETPIKCNDLFKNKTIRRVLTKGVAGIGKTVSVQKFILDWAEGKANQDVTFMFPLPFRDLNLIKQKTFSLMDLLHHFFPKMRKLELIDCDSYKVIFIFDGLDECRLPLNFQNNERLCDVTESASVDVLLTNLIKGNLLPSALIWITSRPGAANQIPPECVDQVTEIRGFSDPQKEEYFKRRISDQRLANNIITHMKSSRSLYIMCHIPVFCWISATVLEIMLGEADSCEIPKTLTQMFTHFLIVQIKYNELKYKQKCDSDLSKFRESILALGKLAFQQLEKGNLIFYEEDLRQCDINVREVSVYSGVCTQIFREESGLHLEKVFSFVHLSVQEFLAALYVLSTFILKKINVIREKNNTFFYVFNKPSMIELLKNAVDKAFQSKDGHLDLFLCFLLGLSLESNQTLLQGLILKTGSSCECREEIIEYIKWRIRTKPSPEKSINLFHCLNELNDHSLVKEIQSYLNREGKSALNGARLSPAHWSALVFVLLKSQEEMTEFDLTKYQPSEECLLWLMPVLKVSVKAVLSMSNLGERSCGALSLVLSSSSSCLRELDLSQNKLKDAGMKLLSEGLQSSHCKLKILWLCGCHLTQRSCTILSSVLSLNSCCLKELNLSGNKLLDSGVKELSEGLKHPHCKLESLWLRACDLKEESCSYLSSVLSSNSSCLMELYLRANDLQDKGVMFLSDGLKNPHCKLKTLGLVSCKITDEGVKALVSALRSNTSSQLKALDLYGNKPGDSGMKLINNLLQDQNYKLESLDIQT